MYKIQLYETFENEKLKKYWKEIYSKNNYCLQNSYEWNLIWWKHFRKKSRKLFIVATETNDSIVGIAPFMIEKKFFFRQLKFIGSGLTDFHEMLALPDQEESILSIILNFIINKKNYDIINLEQISDNSKLFHMIEKNSQFKKREIVKCPIINFISSNWGEYYQRLGKNLRRDWTKKYKKLIREEKLQFIELKTIHDKRGYLEKMFALHIKRCKYENQASKLNQENIQKYILEIVSEIPEIAIYILLYNNKLVSYRLGFKQGAIYYDWNTSYDPKYYSYSIGKILLGLVIKDLIENNYKKLNFMRGNYDYKRKWMTDNETLTNYQFLCKLNPLKGYLGVRYYLEWRWRLKNRFVKIFKKSFIQKILIRLRY